MGKKVDAMLEFVPYKGLGDVKFGMSRAEVKAIMGPAEKVEEDDIMEHIRETRGPLEFFFDWKKKKLDHIDAGKTASVSYNGKSLFQDPGALADVLAKDSSGKEGGGYRNFPKLGLLMGGFGKKRIPEGKVIIFYDKSKAQEIGNMTEV